MNDTPPATLLAAATVPRTWVSRRAPGATRSARGFPFHAQAEVRIAAPAAAIFDYLDDPLHLSAHMSRRSGMMGGGRMRLETDEAGGQRIGSRISLSGRAFGLVLLVEEVVTVRDPPRCKAWETRGRPDLVVIGAYCMGFEIRAAEHDCLLRVFIDYGLPRSRLPKWLLRMLGRFYSNWCTRRMAQDALRHFAPHAP